MVKRLVLVFQTFALIALASAVVIAQNGQSSRSNAQSQQIVPFADHHQHVFSPAYVEKFLPPGSKTITAQDVIGLLDKAGIRRAVLLANGYSFGRPGSEPPDEYAKVKGDNDWAAAQAAMFPKRLIAFCGFNPLKEYALDELARCAKNPNLRRGIKLHFGSSDVQTAIPEHFEKLKKVFQAANSQRMAIVVHMRASISKNAPTDRSKRALLWSCFLSLPIFRYRLLILPVRVRVMTILRRIPSLKFWLMLLRKKTLEHESSGLM